MYTHANTKGNSSYAPMNNLFRLLPVECDAEDS